MRAKVVSQSAFARQQGVSRQLVNRYVQAGMPVTDGGKLDPDKAKRWIARNIERRTKPDESLIDARRRDASASAGLKELKLEVQRGRLVDADGIQRAMERIFMAAREVWLQCIGKISARLNLEPEQQQFVRDAIFHGLQILADGKFLKERSCKRSSSTKN